MVIGGSSQKVCQQVYPAQQKDFIQTDASMITTFQIKMNKLQRPINVCRLKVNENVSHATALHCYIHDLSSGSTSAEGAVDLRTINIR